MKKIFINLMVLNLVSCGKEQPSTNNKQIEYLNDYSSLYIEQAIEIPICSKDNHRQLIFVKELEQFQFCDSDTSWKVVYLGKDGSNGIDGKNGKDGNNGGDGKNGINGKDGTNGKDGLIKNFTVYSNGVAIGSLVDETPTEFIVKTTKGYYFSIDPVTGKIPVKTSFSPMNEYYQNESCNNNGNFGYTEGIRPNQIFAAQTPNGIVVYYTTKNWVYGNKIKYYYIKSQEKCQMITDAKQDIIYSETIPNSNEVTGFEGKYTFELPITIAL